MSIPLPVRAKALRDRLVKLDQMGANVAEAGLLEDLRSDLAAPAAELSRALDQRTLLVDARIAAEAPASLDVARKRAAGLLEKFAAEKNAATLKKGVGWANLVRDIKAASNDVSATVIKSWKAFRQEVFTGEAPDILFTTTEMLNQRMGDDRFRHLFGIGERAQRPVEMMLLDEVHTYAGSSGAQVAFLLRRWRRLLRRHVSFVGLSATLKDGARFFAQLTGLFEQASVEVTPANSDMIAEGAEYLLALRGDPRNTCRARAAVHRLIMKGRVWADLDRLLEDWSTVRLRPDVPAVMGFPFA